MRCFQCLLFAGLLTSSFAQEMTIPLAGSWGFELDAERKGVESRWFARELSDVILLPGTTDEARKGTRNEDRPTDRLARPWRWVGAAWYQRKVEIPDAWAGKQVTLFLERTKNSRLWVNDTYCGGENTLSTPHEFDVTKTLRPGINTITLLIDNSKLPPVGPSHQVDERTQTNWNGIVGAIELRATDPVWIEDAQVDPDGSTGDFKVRATLCNRTGRPAHGRLVIRARSPEPGDKSPYADTEVAVEGIGEEHRIEFTVKPGRSLPKWDEFRPERVQLDLRLEVSNGVDRYESQKVVHFGMREFVARGSQFEVNGTPVFLRGRLDCANYPLTGYAPMDNAEWTRIYQILKEWGLNHVRFHSWCPPKAAFEAADEMGFYLQIELPNKRSAFLAEDSKEAAYHNIDFLEGQNMDESISLYDYAKREAERIFRYYGNHPSFVMFTLGNELGRNEGMFDLVRHFKQSDPRRLYAQGSNNNHWKPSRAEGDDFWVTAKVGDDALPIRGSFYLHDYRYGSIEHSPPGTMDDFRDSLRGVPVPLLGHETGQYQVFPDFSEIPEYTGVLKPRHYEVFRDRLDKAGMLDQARDFVRASGALAAICYREDMELALRTPGFGGFQLLDIADFPGQGTAPVGMLNVFLWPKLAGRGIIDPETWRQSCAPVVPLARMEKLIWTADEMFAAHIEVAHYGPHDLTESVLLCTLRDPEGEVLMAHEIPGRTILRGGLRAVGECVLPLNRVRLPWPQALELQVEINGTGYRNHYPLWVYPKQVDTVPPVGVVVSDSLDEPRKALVDGGKVLLLPKRDKLPMSVPGMFQTEFWSPMFAKSAAKRGIELPPGTLGLLCDPEHPALASFPTQFHSNWQWWHLVKQARSVILDETPREYRPIVQMIDNFDRNHKLGLLFETRYGKGSLLVCSIDLMAHQDKPEARQLLHSLLQYAASDAFAPSVELDREWLHRCLPD